MFSPRRAPKEGRTLPSYIKINDGHRTRQSPRQITIIAILVLSCFLFYLVFRTEAKTVALQSTSTKSRPVSSSGDEKISLKSQDEKEPRKYNGGSADSVEALISRPAESAKPVATEPKEPIREHESHAEEDDSREVTRAKVAGEDFPKSKSPSPRESWTRRPEIDKALARLTELLPDEVHMRELTRSIETSGKERMRELGLRTREYTKYLGAWENLHMMEDAEGSVVVRDDIIQYVRGQHANSKDDPDSQVLAQTIHTYEAYRAFIKNFARVLFPWTAPWFGDHMILRTSFKKGGRGIVLTVGDEQAPYLLTTIYTYRKLGCTLPIEIFYLGDSDLDGDYRADLETLPGVVTRDLAQMVDDDGWKLAGWAAKPFAMLFSSFREVIFIDADAMFFKNPEILFDDPDYIKHGALFFKDRLIMPESKKRWLQQVLPKPIPKLARQSRFWTGESGHQMESGVMVVDKWKHFMAMMLVTRFNGPDRDGKKELGITGVYDMMYGDKETFWLGFLLAGDEDFAFHSGDAGILGELKAEDKDNEDNKESKDGYQGDPDKRKPAENSSNVKQYTICAPQLLHLDAEGRPLWFNGWLLKNKFAEKAKKTFANFDYFLIEPREMREPTAWQLAEANQCCLTADETNEFNKQEKETLQMMIDRAGEMGMGDQT